MTISVRSLTFSYDETPVLKGFSLEIPSGEVWGLLGRSGCGKSTLLNVMAGLFRPAAGTVVISGRQWEPGGIRGVVFQEDCLLPWLSVEENLFFPEKPSEVEKTQQDRAYELLSRVGMARWGKSLPGDLSVGMRKRVELARALVADEQFLLADEPFAAADAATRHELWRLWGDLSRLERRTGLLSTHDPEEVLRLCTGVVILQGGRAVPVTVPSALQTSPGDRDPMALLAFREEILMQLRSGHE